MAISLFQRKKRNCYFQLIIIIIIFLAMIISVIFNRYFFIAQTLKLNRA